MEAPCLPEQLYTHLLEAYLVVFETINDGFYLERAKATLFAASFLEQFAPLSLSGGWIDHIDADGGRLVEYMPASSLYHIYGAGRQIAL